MFRPPCLLAIAFLVVSCNGCGSQSLEESGNQPPVASSLKENDPLDDSTASTDVTPEGVGKSDSNGDEPSDGTPIDEGETTRGDEPSGGTVANGEGERAGKGDEPSDFAVSLSKTDPHVVRVTCPPDTDFSSFECEIKCVPQHLIEDDGESLKYNCSVVKVLAEIKTRNSRGTVAGGRTFMTWASEGSAFKFVTFDDMTGWVTDDGHLELLLHDDISGKVKLFVILSKAGETVANTSIDVDYSKNATTN